MFDHLFCSQDIQLELLMEMYYQVLKQCSMNKLGCPSKHKMSQIELLMGDMLCLYVGDPRNLFQSFFSPNF